MGMSRGFRTAGAATMMVLCAAAPQAGSDGPNNPSFLLFAGTDLWRDSAFVDGGLLWSPAGLNTGGLTGLRALHSRSLSTAASTPIPPADCTRILRARWYPPPPCWRTTRDGFTVDLYAGPVVQDYRLTPYDPGSRLRGFYGGAQVAGDV